MGLVGTHVQRHPDIIGKKEKKKGKKRNFVAEFFSSQCVRGKKL